MNENLVQDILKETFNISVGQAAKMLSDITTKRIILSVPEIVMAKKDNDCDEINAHLLVVPNGAIMLSTIKFGSTLQGEANLLFPAGKMRTFINLCMNQTDIQQVDEDEDMDFTDMDFDILKEVGNIILNSIVGGLGNLLQVSLEYTIPEVRLFDRDKLKEKVERDGNFCALMLYISFTIEKTEIEGAIVINLTVNSLNELMRKIKGMEEELYA